MAYRNVRIWVVEEDEEEEEREIDVRVCLGGLPSTSDHYLLGTVGLVATPNLVSCSFAFAATLVWRRYGCAQT